MVGGFVGFVCCGVGWGGVGVFVWVGGLGGLGCWVCVGCWGCVGVVGCGGWGVLGVFVVGCVLGGVVVVWWCLFGVLCGVVGCLLGCVVGGWCLWLGCGVFVCGVGWFGWCCWVCEVGFWVVSVVVVVGGLVLVGFGGFGIVGFLLGDVWSGGGFWVGLVRWMGVYLGCVMVWLVWVCVGWFC